MSTSNNNLLDIGALKALEHELHPPDGIAAYVLGSRANGYNRPNSDVDLCIITKRSTGIRYIRTKDFPVPINFGYAPQEALEYFSIRRRSGLPFRVLPIDNEPYVSQLAFNTKEELTKRAVSIYHRRGGDKSVPLLLPIAAHMIDQSRLEYWWTPKWLRVMRSNPTADILKEEYAAVFQNLAEKGFFESVDVGYAVNPSRVIDEGLGGDFVRLLGHGFNLLGPKLLLSVAREGIRHLPSKNLYRRMINETANSFIGIPNYFT